MHLTVQPLPERVRFWKMLEPVFVQTGLKTV